MKNHGTIKLFCVSMALILTLCSCLCLTSCSNNINKTIKYPTGEVETVPSGVIAKNDKLSLTWNDDRKVILLTNLSSGQVWSTMPYNTYNDEYGDDTWDSSLVVEFCNSEDSIVHEANAYDDAINGGRVKAEAIKDGIEVTFYFDEYNFAVTLDYILREDSVLVRVDPSKIIEKENKIYRIGVCPYFCSAANTTDRNTSLFIPSGSGALMYTDPDVAGGRVYEQAVYGGDQAAQKQECQTNNENIKLPIFGVQTPTATLAGIIEGGDANAYIYAIAGGADGYSRVNTIFSVRGYDTIVRANTWDKTPVKIYSQDIIDAEPLEVGYYPLEGDQSGINGMANTFRKYLGNKYNYKKNKSESDSSLTLKIYGGLSVKSFILGLPHYEILSMTDYSDAQRIIEDVCKKTDSIPAVQMLGFGESGLNIGKVAGGYKLSTQFGSSKSRKDLVSYCSKNQIPLSFDFDLINFRKSGCGFSKLKSGAKTANLQTAYQYQFSLSTGGVSDSAPRTQLLGRSELLKAATKLFDAAEKMKLKNLSLSSISSVAYSDYRQVRSSVVGNMASDISTIIHDAQDKGYKITTSSANSYAAACADRILDSPSGSGRFFGLDSAIPFYQMIFKGYVPISNVSVNLGVDARSEMLSAIQSGSGLTFSLIQKWDTALTTSGATNLNLCVYDDISDSVIKMYNDCSEYYKQINGASITYFKFLDKENKVSETKFDNGMSVIVNKSSESFESPFGTISSNSFLFGRQ